MPIKLYIVDNHKIFREVITSLMNHQVDIDVVGNAGSVQEFTEDILKHKPDVILMDINLKDGEGTKAITWYKEKNPNCKILVFSTFREDIFLKKVLDSGANGYLLKDVGTEEMLSAIRIIYEGQPYFSPPILNAMMRQITHGNKSKEIKQSKKLTPREIEVLQLIADEKSNQEIADLLFISIRTVTTHRTNLLRKLEVKNTAGLVKFALRKGMIKL